MWGCIPAIPVLGCLKPNEISASLKSGAEQCQRSQPEWGRPQVTGKRHQFGTEDDQNTMPKPMQPLKSQCNCQAAGLVC